MQFNSDNWSGAHPDIVAAIAEEAARDGGAYGSSPVDLALNRRFSELFETDVQVFPVASGTAANSLALAACGRPGGIVLCHSESHVEIDECGAVGLQGDSLRLRLIDGPGGKMQAADLAATIAAFPKGHVHAGQLAALSLTQMSEAGTFYSLDELRGLAALAADAGLAVHMDGARIANALAGCDASPADMTWRSGVDILSFGATKNGCVMADAIVVFDPSLARTLPFLRMRAGHLLSKSRFIAAQFDAYLNDNLWLKMAGHANAMADRLRAGFSKSAAVRLAWPSDGNEVFAIMKTAHHQKLQELGAQFASWAPGPIVLEQDETVVRLVASFNTSAYAVDQLLALAADL